MWISNFLSNFYPLWFFSNLSFFVRDPHMDSPEAIRVKLISTFTAAGLADVQPAAYISFTKMAVNQDSCPRTLQATKSSSLTVRTVQRGPACVVTWHH